MNTDTAMDFTVSGTRTTAVRTPHSAQASAPPAATGCAPEEPCDLVTVPARQGLEAVDIIRRGETPAAVGPVLHDGTCDTLGFLVPPGTAAAWDVPGSACTETNGRGLRIEGLPVAPPVTGSGWLLPPNTTEVTDPGLLRAALGEAARMIEAADGIREADAIRQADGTRRTDGARRADGVRRAEGIRQADGIRRADGIRQADGVRQADTIRQADAIRLTEGR